MARLSGEVFELLKQRAGPHRQAVELRLGFKQDWIADTTRLQAATGWRPEIPLEQTVADTLEYFRDRA